MQTAIDFGTVTVTSVAVQFSGDAKTTQWLHKRVIDRRRQEDRLLIDVANRATVMGIEAPEIALDYVEALADFAGGNNGREETREKLGETRRAVLQTLDFTAQKSAADAARLKALRAKHPSSATENQLEQSTAAAADSSASMTSNPVQKSGPAPQAQTIAPSPPHLVPQQDVSAERREVETVVWGKRAQHVAHKALPTIVDWLGCDEHLVAVYKVNKINPTLSLLAVTDTRVLALEAKPRSGSAPAIDIRRADIDKVEVSGFMTNVAFHTTNGAVCKVGNLVHSTDATSMKALFDRDA